MAIEICIEVGDDGSISVGQKPDDNESADAGADASAGGDQGTGMTDLSQAPADDENAEQSYMQQVGSIDEALAAARGLLKKALQTGGATIGGEPGGDGAQSAADAAFKARRGAKAGF